MAPLEITAIQEDSAGGSGGLCRATGRPGSSHWSCKSKTPWTLKSFPWTEQPNRASRRSTKCPSCLMTAEPATQGSPLLFKGIHRSRLAFHEVPCSPPVSPLKEVVKFYLEAHEIPVVPAEIRGVHGVRTSGGERGVEPEGGGVVPVVGGHRGGARVFLWTPHIHETTYGADDEESSSSDESSGLESDVDERSSERMEINRAPR